MKKSFVSFVLLSLALLVCASDLSAGEISLTIRSGSTYRDNNVLVSSEIRNIGDTAAHNIWLEAFSFGSAGRSEKFELLSTEDVFKASVLLGEQPELRGIYTIIIKVHYEDADGNPFSVLSYIPFISAMPDDLSEGVIAEIPDVSIRKQHDATLTLSKSVGPTSNMEVKLSLAVPDELICSVSDMSMVLEDNGENTVAFQLANSAAVPGSVYSYYAVVDYVYGDLHRSLPVHGIIKILPRSPWPSVLRISAIVLIIVIIFILLLGNVSERAIRIIRSVEKCPYFDAFVLASIFLFLLYQLRPEYWFMDTVSVGGDVPAHNYMASHLKDQLFQNGRIISWSHGWWCGFPMFQYYFCLPYILIALLDCVIPFNAAFKLVSVFGMLSLPFAAYCGAKVMRAPRPVPVLAAVMMVPYLFARSNMMWGVSAYSTLAGMISNSLSFPLMLLFLSYAYRDSDEGRFRINTVILFALLISSHFFTSIMAGLTAVAFPFLKPKAGARRSFAVMAQESIMGMGLMAWWIVPLVAKRDFSVDFGINWEIPLFQISDSFPYVSVGAFPPYALLLLPFAVYGLYQGFRNRSRFTATSLWMLIVALFLYVFGFDVISHVFVNIRLWPFAFYSFLLITCYGLGSVLGRIKGTNLACLLALLLAFVFGAEHPNEVDDWAEWNFEGLENKRSYSVFKELVEPLRNTPGRLANDLSAKNDRALGSSRIFELVPHLVGKPILEGGIVNSAVGSIYSYYIQGETSQNCAGFPTIVEPTTFNLTNATRHLELFNVKHFIARWEKTKEALAGSPEWRFLNSSDEWELYELMSHDGSYVVIPENQPKAVRVKDWKQAGLDWIYDTGNLEQLYILLRDDEALPAGIDEVESFQRVAPRPTDAEGCTVSVKEYSSERIVFETDGVGLPHLIKCTYFPNWKMRGGGAVHMVTPCFMLVYPQSEHVELYYASLFSDNAGRFITFITAVLFFICAVKRFCNVCSKQSA